MGMEAEDVVVPGIQVSCLHQLGKGNEGHCEKESFNVDPFLYLNMAPCAQLHKHIFDLRLIGSIIT